MSNYNNEGGNSRFGANGGGSKFRGNSKKPFARNSRFGNRGGDGTAGMHKATCAECGNACEVPFRPNGEKPVYCKNCFGKMGGGNTGGDRFERKDGMSQTRVWPAPEKNRGNNDAVIKQLEAVNGKLERLIQAVGALVATLPVAEKVKLEETPDPVAKKSSKKKAVKEKE